MIIRSIHFRCCAMRIRAIPSPFQRKTALRVSVAASRYTLLRCTIPLIHVTNPRIALAFLCAETLYFAIPLPCSSAHRNAAALLFNSLPFLCFAWQSGAGHCRRYALQNLAILNRCPVRRANQPAFSSGKKFASCIRQLNFSAVPPRLFPSSSSIL